MTVFRANAPLLDPEELERDLTTIASVGSAVVVLDDDGDVLELRVVCGTQRSPGAVARDVQAVVAARWGIDVDLARVSVVQDDASASAAANERRPATEIRVRVVGTAISVSGETADATVTLARGANEAKGAASGPGSWADQRRLAAVATLDALVCLDAGMSGFVVHDTTVADAAAVDVIVSVLSDGRGISFAGAAPVDDHGELHAAAESVLRAFVPPKLR